MPAHRNNFEKNRSDQNPELFLLHWSAGELLSETDNKFSDPNRLASAHFAIEDAEIHQYVKEPDTAFHAGLTSVDKKAIGIILIGGPNMPISERTYQTVSLLVEELARKYRIPLDRDHIKGHNEVSKGFCPGTVDINRIVVESKALSPATMVERLKREKEEAEAALAQAMVITNTAEARFEELRLQIREKDTKIQQMAEDFIYLTMQNHKLEDYLNRKNIALEELSLYNNRPIFAIILERIKQKYAKYI